MTEPKSAAVSTILLVDRDLGFLAWLSQMLLRADYQAVPATSFQKAASLVGQLGLDVDLVIAELPLLAEAELEVMDNFRGRAGPPRVIGADPGLQTGTADIARHTNIVATLRKPSSSGSPPEDEWLQAVREILDRIRSRENMR